MVEFAPVRTRATAGTLDVRRLRADLTTAARSGPLGVRSMAVRAADATATLAQSIVLDDPAGRPKVSVTAAELATLPGRLAALAAGQPLDPAAIARLAQATAVGVHVRSLVGWQRGLAVGGGNRRGLTALAATRDRSYVAALGRLRAAALSGSVVAVLDAVAGLVDDAAETATYAERVGRSAERSETALSLAVLVHNQAMAAAGGIQLAGRLSAPRRARAAVTSVGGAARLRRPPPQLAAVRTGLTTHDLGRHLAVLGRTTAVDFLELPRKPYSRLLLAGAGPEVRVPRRNVQRLGVTADSWVWAMGEVKVVEGAAVLEVEFEGPGQHDKDVFEDLLAVLARPVYDRYPGVLQLEWQLPARGRSIGSNDLTSRLRFGGH